LVIDTEGSILPERAAEMARALSKHLGKVAARAEAAAERAAERGDSGTADATRAEAAAKRSAAETAGTPTALLSSVRVLRVRDAAELTAAVAVLPGICER